MKEEIKFLNENEVSAMTGLSVQTLRNWRFNKKGMAYVKAGTRAVRYKLEDILSFMELNKVTPYKNVPE